MSSTAMPINPINPYIAHPLCVAQVNPDTGRHTRAFFFLGGAPRAVLAAARRGKPRGADPRMVDWAPAEAAVLRGHYGPHWRDLLTASDPPPSETGTLAARRAVSFFGSDAGDLAPRAVDEGALGGDASGGFGEEEDPGENVRAPANELGVLLDAVWPSRIFGGDALGGDTLGEEGEEAALDFGDLRELDEATSRIEIHGARYSEMSQRMVDR